MHKCVNMPNFAAIGQSMIEISLFSNYKMAAVRHLGFLKIQNFSGRQGYEGEHASSCKISWQSAKPYTEIWRFLDFYSVRNARIASALLATAIPSVRLSVRLPHAVLSKRRHVARCSFHRWIAKCV